MFWKDLHYIAVYNKNNWFFDVESVESSDFEAEKSHKNTEYINSFKVFVLSFRI